MNRIRKYNNKYQVLTTPHQKYNSGFEFLLGSWTDEGLMGFNVEEYESYKEAVDQTYDSPDINWDQLIEFHKDNFYFLSNELDKIIKQSTIPVRIKSHLMKPEEAKNKLFDRVIKGQDIANIDDENSFRLIYDMNDIISFVITNPWSKNLNELSQRLIQHSRLNIFNIIKKNSVIHLIGRTDIGTTYEIILVPDTINNWMLWRNINSNVLSKEKLVLSLRNIIKLQNNIDNSYILR